MTTVPVYELTPASLLALPEWLRPLPRLRYRVGPTEGDGTRVDLLAEDPHGKPGPRVAVIIIPTPYSRRVWDSDECHPLCWVLQDALADTRWRITATASWASTPTARRFRFTHHSARVSRMSGGGW